MHVLGRYLVELPVGDQPFAGISAGRALRKLREALELFSATRKDSGIYRCHDLRRGHAKDLVESGASLVEILAAGQWRSPAFLKYLDLRTLERDAVLAACVDESSGGEEEALTLSRTVAAVPLPPICPPSFGAVGLQEPNPFARQLDFGESEDEDSHE